MALYNMAVSFEPNPKPIEHGSQSYPCYPVITTKIKRDGVFLVDALDYALRENRYINAKLIIDLPLPDLLDTAEDMAKRFPSYGLGQPTISTGYFPENITSEMALEDLLNGGVIEIAPGDDCLKIEVPEANVLFGRFCFPRKDLSQHGSGSIHLTSTVNLSYLVADILIEKGGVPEEEREGLMETLLKLYSGYPLPSRNQE